DDFSLQVDPLTVKESVTVAPRTTTVVTSANSSSSSSSSSSTTTTTINQ
ncbi:unnamed protein product, partial [Rotaria socialis]